MILIAYGKNFRNKTLLQSNILIYLLNFVSYEWIEYLEFYIHENLYYAVKVKFTKLFQRSSVKRS